MQNTEKWELLQQKVREELQDLINKGMLPPHSKREEGGNIFFDFEQEIVGATVSFIQLDYGDWSVLHNFGNKLYGLFINGRKAGFVVNKIVVPKEDHATLKEFIEKVNLIMKMDKE